MNIVTIVSLAVCVSVMAMCVKEIKPEVGQLISVASSVALLMIIIPHANEAIQAVKEISNYSESGTQFIGPILKITGIAYITQMGSELCLDANEKALAGRVEMAGKIAICLLTIPIAREAFIRIVGIIK